MAVLKTCYDPEIPVDIFALGLIYEVEVSDSQDVHVTMTLTSPACPVAGTLPPEIEHKIKAHVRASPRPWSRSYGIRRGRST